VDEYLLGNWQQFSTGGPCTTIHGFARTIDWFEIVLKGILQYLVQELVRHAVSRLGINRAKLNPLLKRWTLNGLGTAYLGWALICFLGWVSFTLNSVTQQGFGSMLGILNYVLASWGFILSVGFPGMGLNRVAQRLDPKHWVTRMTESYSTLRVGSEKRRKTAKSYVSYIQVLRRKVWDTLTTGYSSTPK